MSPTRQSFKLRVALCALAAFSAACGKASGTKGTSSGGSGASSLNLEQTDSFEKSLSVAANDEIVTLGRLSATKLVASARSGAAWNVDLEEETVEDVASFFKFDAEKESLFTVSKDYVWVLFGADQMIGRNKKAPDANRKFEISKAALEGTAEVDELQPLSVSETQFFALTRSELVIFTYAEEAINVKKIALPGGKLGAKEYALGGGPIDDPDKNYGIWLATNERFLRFQNRWAQESLTLKSAEESPSLISMSFKGKAKPVEDGATVGLFGANVLAKMTSGNEKSAKKGKDEEKEAEAEEEGDSDPTE